MHFGAHACAADRFHKQVTCKMASRSHSSHLLSSDPEFLLEFMEEIPSDSKFDGYVDDLDCIEDQQSDDDDVYSTTCL